MKRAEIGTVMVKGLRPEARTNTSYVALGIPDVSTANEETRGVGLCRDTHVERCETYWGWRVALRSISEVSHQV